MTNTPSIITKTPAALLFTPGGRRGEEPHQHTQTQGPQNIPSLTIATEEQHTLSWRSGDPGIGGGLGRAGPSPYSSYSASEHLNITPRQGHQSYPARPALQLAYDLRALRKTLARFSLVEEMYSAKVLINVAEHVLTPVQTQAAADG